MKKIVTFLATALVLVGLATTVSVYAGTTCGSGDYAVETAIDLGCSGQGNPITDMLGGVIQYVGAFAGIVAAGAIVWAGIQYAASQGDPQKVSSAKNRLLNAIIGLVFYVFLYAIIEFLVPGGLI